MDVKELSKYKDVEIQEEQKCLISIHPSLFEIDWDFSVKIQPEKQEDKVINFLAVYLKPNPKTIFRLI